ncbi:hypothetical protein EIJ50_03825 [Xanthomonas perforans]|nr:hypothetical protein [Xanthomonas perforans]TQU16234.1 hypothetical protein EIJ50_03825 [Xanthomonas perforans]
MRQGNFVHQVAMSFSLDPYHQACSTIDPSSEESHVLPKRGYLLMVAANIGATPAWQCRYAGTAVQIRQAWSSDPNLSMEAGVDSARLCQWFDGLVSSAVPASRVSTDMFADLVAHLRWDAKALERGRRDPLTLALASSGALHAEGSTLSLDTNNLPAVEMRLGWLLATSKGAPGPKFTLESQASLSRLCLKLCRLHAMTIELAGR